MEDFAKVANKRTAQVTTTIVEEVKTVNNIKKLAEIDPKRFSFIPAKGDRNYSRLCQNQFQPKAYVADKVQELVQDGYIFDEENSNTFIIITVLSRAVRMMNQDTKQYYYLACDPKRKAHVFGIPGSVEAS